MGCDLGVFCGSQFLRLGRVGYAAVMRNCWEVSNYLADRIDKLGYFKVSLLSYCNGER